MNQVRLHRRDDVVNHFALESKCEVRIFIALRVNRVTIVEATVFCQVNARIRKVRLIGAQFVSNQTAHIDMEHATIVWKGHMHICTQLE